jgi:hypothetical protein
VLLEEPGRDDADDEDAEEEDVPFVAATVVRLAAGALVLDPWAAGAEAVETRELTEAVEATEP